MTAGTKTPETLSAIRASGALVAAASDTVRMICASVGPSVPRIRLLPDGDPRTIVLTPQFRRRHLSALAEFWRVGWVKFEDPAAYSAFLASLPLIVGAR